MTASSAGCRVQIPALSLFKGPPVWTGVIAGSIENWKEIPLIRGQEISESRKE